MRASRAGCARGSTAAQPVLGRRRRRQTATLGVVATEPGDDAKRAALNPLCERQGSVGHGNPVDMHGPGFSVSGLDRRGDEERANESDQQRARTETR